ncbi:MAG: hypothetical protein ACKVJG_00960 [Candidatus Latescibacterota bacterium]
MLDVDFALRSDRTKKALTGLSRVEFQLLCPAFGQALMDNGLAIEPALHKLFDVGAWTLTDERGVLSRLN